MRGGARGTHPLLAVGLAGKSQRVLPLRPSLINLMSLIASQCVVGSTPTSLWASPWSSGTASLVRPGLMALITARKSSCETQTCSSSEN